MATESLAFVAAIISIGALWMLAQFVARKTGNVTVNDLLSTRAVAQTIATQQEKIDFLNQEVLKLERTIGDMQNRLDRALEKVAQLERDLKRVTEERDVLQRMARGLSISDSTVHVAHDIAGGDVTIGRDQTQAGHDAAKGKEGEGK